MKIERAPNRAEFEATHTSCKHGYDLHGHGPRSSNCRFVLAWVPDPENPSLKTQEFCSCEISYEAASFFDEVDDRSALIEKVRDDIAEAQARLDALTAMTASISDVALLTQLAAMGATTRSGLDTLRSQLATLEGAK